MHRRHDRSVSRPLARPLTAAAGILLASTLTPAPATAAPAATPPPLSLADVARTASVRQVRIAPDGSLVAYTVQVPRAPWTEDDGPAWSELHVAGRDGASRAFVAGEVNVSQVAFTPDGREIAFVAKRKGDERSGLYTIPRDGGEARRRLAHGTDVEGFDLFADGSGRVAFLAREKKPEAVEAREKKGFNQDVFEESARPVKVWLGRLDGTEAPRALELPGSASELHVSPKGDRLAVALAPAPGVDDEMMERQVHVVSLPDGKVVARVEHRGKLGKVAWSPDGTRLAFVGAADRHDPSTSMVAVVPASGGAPRSLLPDLLAHPLAFAWEGDASLAVLVARGVGSELLAVPAAGGAPRTLVPRGPLVWSGFERARDGSTAFAADGPSRPGDAYLLLPGAAQPRRLGDLNPWLAGRRLAPQSVVTWKARDGLELEGLLLTPPDRAPGARAPLVVVVHGGPEGHFSDGWLTHYSSPGQVLAAKGFAVFYPNYRGSTGRGLAFSRTSQGDPAGREFDDLVDGVDHLVGSGLADPARVGITGGSYGGYATLWGATRLSERFAAAVSFVGISELTSKAGTTDIPVEDVDVHLVTMPWTRWELNRERSPLTYVEKARTPLLILHGTDDPRVHPSQSLLIYRYLKLLGKVPVRLVRYPGEGHGNRRAASQLDLSARLVQWMEHYLLGPGGAPPPPEVDPKAVLGIAEPAQVKP